MSFKNMKSEFTVQINKKTEWLMCDSIFLTLIEFSAAIIHRRNTFFQKKKHKTKAITSSLPFATCHFDCDNKWQWQKLFSQPQIIWLIVYWVINRESISLLWGHVYMAWRINEFWPDLNRRIDNCYYFKLN